MLSLFTAWKIKNKDTILFCHNTIKDFGLFFPFLIDMFITLKVNFFHIIIQVLVSIGKFSKENTNNEIIQIIEFINQLLNIPLNKLILLDQSLRNIPVLYLC